MTAWGKCPFVGHTVTKCPGIYWNVYVFFPIFSGPRIHGCNTSVVITLWSSLLTVQCGAVITRSIFSNSVTKPLHISPVRAIYWVSFVITKSELCNGWATTVFLWNITLYRTALQWHPIVYVVFIPVNMFADFLTELYGGFRLEVQTMFIW